MLGCRALHSDLTVALPAHPPLTRTPLAFAGARGRRRPSSRTTGRPERPAAGRGCPGGSPCHRASPPGRTRGRRRGDSLRRSCVGDEHPPGPPRRGATPRQASQAAHALRRQGRFHCLLAGDNDRSRCRRHHDRPAGGPGKRGLRVASGHHQGARGFTLYRSQPHAGAARPARPRRGGMRGRFSQVGGERLASSCANVVGWAPAGCHGSWCRHSGWPR